MALGFLFPAQDKNRFTWIPASAEMIIFVSRHLRASGNPPAELTLEIIPKTCPVLEIQVIEAVLAVQFAHALAWEISMVPSGAHGHWVFPNLCAPESGRRQ